MARQSGRIQPWDRLAAFAPVRLMTEIRFRRNRLPLASQAQPWWLQAVPF
jgi:hypothetical protein